jgi:hypothetical protein
MLRETEKFLQTNISGEVASKLRPVIRSAEDLREVATWREDPAHRRAHILDAKYIFNYLAVKSNLSQGQVDLGLRTIELHDTGRRFVELGLITAEQHCEGSIFYASFIDPDPRILSAIRHHTDDVLPEKIDFWIRLVRDADRISVLGYTGANRLARFWGFKDPQLDAFGDEEYIKRKLFCDLSSPSEPGRYGFSSFYEKNAYSYFQGRVTPYLSENNLYKNFCHNMQTFLERFYGVRDRGVSIVEPVCEVAKTNYLRRAFANEAILIHPSYMNDSQIGSKVVHNVYNI